MKKKYTIDDFNRGDEVYHLTDYNQKMIVIGKNNETSEINCRWIKDGKEELRTYFVEELGKWTDKSSGVRISSIDRTRHGY